MIWIAVILIVVGLVFALIAASDSDSESSVGAFLCGVFFLVAGVVIIGFECHNFGVIAHASGKVTATRIDHGDTIEWKIENAKEKP